MTDNDAVRRIETAPMHWRQWLAVVITVLLNALDGFDVLSSAFAGPGIKAEWHLGPDGLGIVLSMELIGMGLGSVVLGGVADRFGRCPAILACLGVMVVGMFGAATSHSPETLSIWRVLTGLGIGGMLAAVNALTHELSNQQRRPIAMALMVIGYPLGAFFGGLVAAMLMPAFGWRAVFVLGGGMTLVLIPLFLLFVPEPPAWLAGAGRARGGDTLARINHTLRRLGHAPVTQLPPPPPVPPRADFAALFSRQHLRVTLLVAFAYAAHAVSFYFILKMVPPILSDPQFAGYHYARPDAARALAFANLGGAIGGASFGWLMRVLGTRRATLCGMVVSVIAVAAFGLGQPDLTHWIIAIAVIASVTNATIVGFYAAFASIYPPELKAMGTGFALTVGRIGSAIAPIASGLLFKHGVPLQEVSVIMAMGSLVALVLFIGLPARRTDGHAPDMVMADL